MTQVDALFQDGVFKPLHQVDLPENQRVTLSIRTVEVRDVEAWLSHIEERNQRIIANRGYLPDSTLDIAEDRRR